MATIKCTCVEMLTFSVSIAGMTGDMEAETGTTEDTTTEEEGVEAPAVWQEETRTGIRSSAYAVHHLLNTQAMLGTSTTAGWSMETGKEAKELR